MRRAIYTLLILALLFSCSSEKEKQNEFSDIDETQAATAIPLNKEEVNKYENIIDTFLQHHLLRGGFNGSILVAKNGQILYESYNGYRDMKLKDTLTASTPLQIASTSKTFTSAAVLKLVQEGKIRLSDSLQTYFPDLPYKNISVKMLLNHRSGLPNYLYFFDQTDWDKKNFLTNNDVVAALIKWHPPIAFLPDRRFQYCNTNYVLLASIIEKVSGKSFPIYMQDNFFGPLNMTNTYVFTMKDSLKSTPSYNASSGPWALDFTDGPYGDKNIYSTPRDLLKWDQAWYSNRIVNSSLKDSAFTPYSMERQSTHNYGLGWRLLQFDNGKKVLYHNGRWHGFNSAFSRLPDEKVVIIILGNKYKSSIYTVARKLYNLFGDYDEKGSHTVE